MEASLSSLQVRWYWLSKAAPAAFIASCNMTKHLINDLLHNIPPSFKDISIDDKMTREVKAISPLEQLIGESACFTQCNLQAKLDSLQYKDLLVALNMCLRGLFWVLCYFWLILMTFVACIFPMEQE